MTSGLHQLYPGVKARPSSGWGSFVLLVLQMVVPTGGSLPARPPCRPLVVRPIVGIADRPADGSFSRAAVCQPIRIEAAIPTGVRPCNRPPGGRPPPSRRPSVGCPPGRLHGGRPPPSLGRPRGRPLGCPLCGRPPASSPRLAVPLLHPVDLLRQRYSQWLNFR